MSQILPVDAALPSRHPMYPRWSSMFVRSRKQQVIDPVTGQAEAINVCPAWHPSSALGFTNYVTWLTAAVGALNICRSHFRIKLKDRRLGFSPENCYVVPQRGWDTTTLQNRTDTAAYRRARTVAKHRKPPKEDTSID